MFAPQPINIRYGNDGLLGQAAFSAGASLGQNRDMGNALQLAEFNLRSQQQGQAEQDQMALESQKLQMAQQLQQQRIQGSPTSGLYSRGNGSPLTQSLVASKNLARTTALAGVKLDDTQSAQLDSLERDPTTPLSTYAGLVDKIRQQSDSATKTSDAQASGAAEIASKQHFIQQIAPGLKDGILPEEGHGLWQMANDPKMSMNELRLQANLVQKNIANRKGVAAQQQQKLSAFQSAQQTGAIHSDDVDTLQAAANDPKVTSQQLVSDIRASTTKKSLESRQALNRQVRAISSQRVQAEKDAAQIESQNKGFIDFTGDESQFGPKDGQYLAAFKQWQSKKAEATSLSQKAASLSNVGTGPGLATPATQFVQTATNPQTGHRIGQRPDGQWVDAQSGQPVDASTGANVDTLQLQ